jgi:hypothetical protein
VSEEPGLLLPIDGSRENHAGGGHSVGEKTFDQGLELIDGREPDFDEESFSAGDVMALLDRVDGGEKLQERAVVGVVAGEADEGHDRVAEGFLIEQGAIAEDDVVGFELVDSFGHGRGRKPDLAAELCVRDSGVLGERADDVVVDGVKILSHGCRLVACSWMTLPRYQV